MTLLASALVGTWRLERWEIVYDDGRPAECPLGEDAVGYLIYTSDGHVSASLARAERAPVDAGDASSKARAFDAYFGYAGGYEVRDGAVIHRIAIAPNPALTGVETLRNASLDGERLTLSGPDFSAASRGRIASSGGACPDSGLPASGSSGGVGLRRDEDLGVALPDDDLGVPAGRGQGPSADLRVEGLLAPGIGRCPVDVDGDGVRIFVEGHDQLGPGRLPAFIQREIEQIPAIELAAFGGPVLIYPAAAGLLAMRADNHRRLVELRDAQELAASRAPEAIAPLQRAHVHRHQGPSRSFDAITAMVRW